jgi:hypothetical protein
VTQEAEIGVSWFKASLGKVCMSLSQKLNNIKRTVEHGSSGKVVKCLSRKHESLNSISSTENNNSSTDNLVCIGKYHFIPFLVPSVHSPAWACSVNFLGLCMLSKFRFFIVKRNGHIKFHLLWKFK